jgi:hypothetical protein
MLPYSNIEMHGATSHAPDLSARLPRIDQRVHAGHRRERLADLVRDQRYDRVGDFMGDSDALLLPGLPR